jgi:hypothetical protein
MGSIRPWPLSFSYAVRVSSGIGRTDGNNNANNGDDARRHNPGMVKGVLVHMFSLKFKDRTALKVCQEKSKHQPLPIDNFPLGPLCVIIQLIWPSAKTIF